MGESAELRGQSVELRIAWDPAVEPMPAVYANYAQGSFTPEDFVVQFGWYAPPPVSAMPEDGVVTAHVQPVARVVLPLNLMRNLIALLERQIDAYEKSFGPVPEHPNPPAGLREGDAPS